MQHTFLERTKAITGAALIGLGIVILYRNLDQAVNQLSHLGTPKDLLGVLPAVVLTALQLLQAYASDHQRFLQDLFQHLLVTFWPLLLVVAGTALSQDAVPGKMNAAIKKDRGSVDLTAPRSTLK
jgi:hypothetical protein